jgi:hypothetical protein
MLLLLLLALFSFSSVLGEEEYFEESGADCSSFRGTYSTILQITSGSVALNMYSVQDDALSATDGLGNYRDLYNFAPDIPARVAILDDCSFIVNPNQGEYDRISGYESSLTGNVYFCGVATQEETSFTTTTRMLGPNFMVYTPDVYNNYFDGTLCTIVDEKNILCSIQVYGAINFRAHLKLRNHDIDDDIDADASGVTFLSRCSTDPDWYNE